MKTRCLEVMPYDCGFTTRNGNYELCHATGVEVYSDEDGMWYYEYVDSFGEYHYA